MKCRKCKIEMVFSYSEWGDDDHGNCGEVVYDKCPKCGKEKFNEKKSYSFGYNC